MKDNPIKGDNDWQEYGFDIDIPSTAATLAFGTKLTGSGHLWLDSVKIDIIGEAKPIVKPHNHSDAPDDSWADAPQNLGFEQ